MTYPVIARITLLASSLVVFTPSLDKADNHRLHVNSMKTAMAEDPWRSELEELCARSNDAMTFSIQELKTLVERCDKLKPKIEALDESSRKVYGKRLKMCRDFYAFMLEGKTEGAPKQH